MKQSPTVALILCSAAACGFPDLTSATWDGGATAESGSSSGVIDASSADGDATADAPRDVLADRGETSLGADANPCDEDGDSYLSMRCAGTDCCDIDSAAHPGETQWFTQADACGSFDYNCDGKQESEYPASLTCGYVWSVGCIPYCAGASCVCGGASCSTGYVGPDPGCGKSAEYDQCQPANVFSCSPKAIAPSQTQACR